METVIGSWLWVLGLSPIRSFSYPICSTLHYRSSLRCPCELSFLRQHYYK